jgi:hypothetical protein
MGIGLGPLQSLFSLAVQNAAPPHQLGVATSASQFFRQIGSTVGVAVFGAVLSYNLAVGGAALPHAAGAPAAITVNDLEKMAVAAMPGMSNGAAAPPLDPAVQQLIASSIAGVFNASLVVLIFGFVMVLLIPELPLRQRHVEPEAPAEPDDQPAVVAAEAKSASGKASKAGRAKR